MLIGLLQAFTAKNIKNNHEYLVKTHIFCCKSLMVKYLRLESGWWAYLLHAGRVKAYTRPAAC